MTDVSSPDASDDPPAKTPIGPVPAKRGHFHLLRNGPPMSRRAVWFAAAVLVATAVFSAGGMILYWPHQNLVPSVAEGEAATEVNAVVVSVYEFPCPPPQPGEEPSPAGQVVKCGAVFVRPESGADRGRQVATNLPDGPGTPTVHPGDEVVLTQTDGSDGFTYQIADHRRSTQLWLLAALFVLAVLAFGRLRGLAALAGLAVTFTILLLFIVPAILGGGPPVLVAIVGSAAIMLSVLYLTHGFNVATSVAVLGTLASLTLTGVLATLSTAALHLTGISGEDDLFLSVAYHQLDMRGLLLAGILIGTLGVLDDVAVTQAVTIDELAAANPSLTVRQLYRSGARVGRAHITAVINTIILAYAGASLPLLLLLSTSQSPLGQVLTTQQMAQEIVRSIVGTIGLIAAVPITTGLAALTARRVSGTHTGTGAAKAKATARSARRSRRRLPPDAIRTGWLDDDSDANTWPATKE